MMVRKKDEHTETDTTTQEVGKIAEKSESDELRSQIMELTDTLKRVQAEFENYKKRIEKDSQTIIKNSNAELIRQLLPVLDSFELAIKNSTGNQEIDKFRKGLELIYAQLFSILEDQGLRPIETKDKKFDPYKHEVLLVKESDKEDDYILQEFQKGYMLNDIVLRHTKVMISKHHEEIKNIPEGK